MLLKSNKCFCEFREWLEESTHPEPCDSFCRLPWTVVVQPLVIHVFGTSGVVENRWTQKLPLENIRWMPARRKAFCNVLGNSYLLYFRNVFTNSHLTVILFLQIKARLTNACTKYWRFAWWRSSDHPPKLLLLSDSRFLSVKSEHNMPSQAQTPFCNTAEYSAL